MLQRLQSIFQNTFFTAFVLFVILVISLASAISAVILLPTSIGEEPQTLFLDEMYYFSSLELGTFDYLDIEYTQGGFIVPAYTRSGSVKGVSLIGDASYYFYPDDSGFRDQGELTELYMPINEEQLAMLLLRTEFTEITSRNQLISADNETISLEESADLFDDIRHQASALMLQKPEMYISIHLFGYKRLYLPDANIAMAMLITSEGDRLVYNENSTITLYDSQTSEQLFQSTHPFIEYGYPPDNLLLYALITLSLLLFSAIIVVWLLTVDLDEHKRVQELVKHIEYPHWLIALALLLYFITQFLIMPYSISDYWVPVLIACNYLLIILVFCKNSYEREYIGLTFKHWGHAISSALLLGFFFQMLGSFNIPTSFNIESYTDLLSMFLIAFFFYALINEIIFRGIIQNYIERLTTTWIAIIGTAGIVALINYIINQYIYNMAHIEVLLQSFLIAPVGSVVLSLLYVRTRSLLASSLLATLLIILPRILVF
ncbi:CPBP family intramembrane glutamic endopeptidase [Desulfuribacillus alkaliarsenatis]|uniref:CAAX prenyl protease 2/Lysostaphin resistance protein A-like domain-containing protein n=1 Tax=Desulfuribacillus alkaliarsenatis TaxID=766136 RepID=A0A1E5FZA6_9FIRM|nr:CPBP family intramembrane glutamic endopeptidase [Desulfuribacillus alkaliarsenatis]OEF95777.1 hypothetical protein BHF68_11815 [Desulfuribacillus alkaliarsenatis]